MFCAEKQTINIVLLFQEKVFKFCQLLIWDKKRKSIDSTYGHKYMYAHEICMFFQKGWSKLRLWKGYSTMFRFNPSSEGTQRNYKHPTEKPLKIIRDFIKNSSDENHIVLDTFMGSGTTAVACKQLNRNFIGFEIAPEYVKIGNDRLNQVNLMEWFK